CLYYDLASPELYTLSLHDALPIFAIAYGLNSDEFRELGDLRLQLKTFLASGQLQLTEQGLREPPLPSDLSTLTNGNQIGWQRWRSEEHTSELQSLAYLVCRLLLEK